MTLVLRDARIDEAAALSELMLRSKAMHGYDAAFIEACRSELRITAERLAAERIRVALLDDAPAGVCAVCFEDAPDEAELTALFVEPAHLGTGVGRALWLDALDACARRNVQKLRIEADPGAVAWYERRGAVIVGEAPSGSIPGRRLPLLELTSSRRTPPTWP